MSWNGHSFFIQRNVSEGGGHSSGWFLSYNVSLLSRFFIKSTQSFARQNYEYLAVRSLVKASCDSDSVSVRAHRHISILIKNSALEIWPLLPSLRPMIWKYTRYRQIVSLPVLAASQGTFADFKSRWTNLAWSTSATWQKVKQTNAFSSDITVVSKYLE